MLLRTPPPRPSKLTPVSPSRTFGPPTGPAGGTRSKERQRPDVQVARVFLVDDDRAILSAYATLLSLFPSIQVVGSAYSGEEALQRLHGVEHDLVTVDLSMPGMGGLALVKRLRTSGYSGQILVITSQDDPTTRQCALDAGANAFLSKSATRELVKQILAMVGVTNR